jgi:nucleotide-binding universal stress UspA family protein
MKRIRRILHPSDFSPASRPAFERAMDMAKGNRAELLLVHVLAAVAPMVGDGYISPKAWDDLERSIQAQGRRQLDSLLARARRAGVRVRGFLVEGRPHEAITRAARSKRADLIVMGTHGRGGLAKLFLGSVAERVVATARCPVLTVKGR